ncbi:MAG: signal peptidase I [Patescibacteria group bacterium]
MPSKILYSSGVIFDVARWVILIAVILALVNTFWLTLFFVDGVSMETNMHDGELALLQKNGYAGKSEPARGDIVVVQYPGDPEHRRYVKRVVGLPGEALSVSAGRVLVNNKEIDEDYLPVDVTTEPAGSWTIGPNEYFLMGDNRFASNDSRYFGSVEKRFFLGKVLAVVFPRLRSADDL